MTKQELIQQAYGESWELCKDFTDENGYCVVFKYSDHGYKGIAGNQTHFKEDEIEGGQMVHSVHGEGISFRPKTLHGIEHNNGWTKIESESYLPKYNSGGKYKCFTEIGNEVDLNGANAVRNAYRHSDVTHYRLVEELPKPLY